MLVPSIDRLLLLAACFASFVGTCFAQSQGNLVGIWSFDPDRKKVYVDSVNDGRRGAAMSEIASAMGLARVEGSQYELGADHEGPFLSITDKTSKLPAVIHVTVSRGANELILTAKKGPQRFRLRPIDPRHLDLVDEQKGVIIPLMRQ